MIEGILLSFLLAWVGQDRHTTTTPSSGLLRSLLQSGDEAHELSEAERERARVLLERSARKKAKKEKRRAEKEQRRSKRVKGADKKKEEAKKSIVK